MHRINLQNTGTFELPETPVGEVSWYPGDLSGVEITLLEKNDPPPRANFVAQWYSKVLSDLLDVLELEGNWDGMGGDSVRLESFELASEFVHRLKRWMEEQPTHIQQALSKMCPYLQSSGTVEFFVWWEADQHHYVFIDMGKPCEIDGNPTGKTIEIMWLADKEEQTVHFHDVSATLDWFTRRIGRVFKKGQ